MTAYPKTAFSYLAIWVAGALTWIPLFLFGLFLFIGPFAHIRLNLGPFSSLFFNTGLSLLFFFQHSFMIRKSFLAWLGNRIAAAYHRALFAAASGTALMGVVLFWQPSPDPVWIIGGFFRWVLRGLGLMAVLGFAWAGLALEITDISGAKNIKLHLQETAPESAEFTIAGPYGWVRHPLYFCTLLMIWSAPHITTDRLLFNLLWSAWIVIGTHLEEKDLVQTFGETYQHYQKKVPMLIPHPLKKGKRPCP